MRRPEIVLLCGPNGSGKSTFFDRRLAKWAIPFVNPDIIAAKLAAGQEGDFAFRATRAANEERERLLAARQSFVTEGIRFDSALMSRGRELGYVIRAVFVCLESPEMNVGRVLLRVSQGGHSVPLGAVAARYERSLESAREAARLADHFYVFDNSQRDRSHRLLARFKGGKLIALRRKIPDWAQRTFRAEFDQFRLQQNARRED